MKIANLVLGAAITGALVATGCDPPRASEVREPEISRPPAQRIGAGVTSPEDAPIAPPPVVERPGPAPDQPATWIPGHWSWNTKRGAFLWVRGVWALKETSFEPPPPRAETPTAAPSPAMFWAPGAWMYRGKDFLWISGHWEKTRPGLVYVAPHWEPDGKKWRFVEEAWRPG